jgi:hypothetical protein
MCSGRELGGADMIATSKAAALAAILALAASTTARAADPAPGFYPGGSEMAITDKAAYQAFLQHNKAKIDQIAVAIAVVRANPQARGCIDATVPACIATLAQVYPLGSRFTADPRYQSQNSPLDDPEVDINGKPLRTPVISLTLLVGRLGVDPLREVFLAQAPNGSVDRVDISILDTPLRARTFEEYERTKVYEATTAVMPGSCDLSDRRAFYQFIENVMKPTLSGDHSVEASALAITDYTNLKATGQLCGLNLEIRQDDSVSTDDVTLTNPHGVSISYWLGVSKPKTGAAPTPAKPLHLGIRFLNLPPEIAKGMRQPTLTGAWVVTVEPGSVAEKAGFKAGDVVTVYDGVPVHGFADLQKAAAASVSKGEVTATVVRLDGSVELHPKF